MSILYITVAISLQSLTTLRWSRIGCVSLIVSLLLLLETTNLIYLNTLTYNSGFASLSLYNGLMHKNQITSTMDALILSTGIILIHFYSSRWNSSSIPHFAIKESNQREEGKMQSSRILFYLCTILGSSVLLGSSDLLILLLGVELQSYSLYLIATSSSQGKEELKEASEAAGLKYYLLGALASSLIVLGIGLLYASLGSTNIYTISILIQSSSELGGHLTIGLGILFILIGFIWKFGGAPLHSWAIDVYDAVPTRSASWLAIVPKIALITITCELILSFKEASFVPLDWKNLFNINPILQVTGIQVITLILFVSFMSMVIGAIGALTQPLIKRLFAYSSVSQLGFVLLGLGIQANETSLFYLLQYTLVNTGLWLCLLTVPSFRKSGLFIKSSNPLNSNSNSSSLFQIQRIKEIRTIKELQGIHISNVFLSIAFTLLLFSTAGIPPMSGFFAKFEVLSSSLNKGWLGLSLIAITASLISATYYIKVIRAMWFTSEIKPSLEQKGLTCNNQTFLPSILALPLSIITLASSLFLLQGSVILTWCKLLIMV